MLLINTPCPAESGWKPPSPWRFMVGGGTVPTLLRPGCFAVSALSAVVSWSRQSDHHAICLNILCWKSQTVEGRKTWGTGQWRIIEHCSQWSIIRNEGGVVWGYLIWTSKYCGMFLRMSHHLRVVFVIYLMLNYLCFFFNDIMWCQTSKYIVHECRKVHPEEKNISLWNCAIPTLWSSAQGPGWMAIYSQRLLNCALPYFWNGALGSR